MKSHGVHIPRDTFGKCWPGGQQCTASKGHGGVPPGTVVNSSLISFSGNQRDGGSCIKKLPS